MYKLNEEDWLFITNAIKDEKCILFVGPEFYNNKEGLSVNELLVQKLDLENNPHITSYFKSDNFFQFKDPPARTYTVHKIKSFYESEQFPNTEELFKVIAELPFHIIFNLNPDNLLSDVFRKTGINCQQSYYAKNITPSFELSKVSQSRPLIYNIFGSLDYDESLVLSHDDLFEYLKSIFKESSMDANLKKELKSAKLFLLLGVDFDHWYIQLLLRLLELHNRNNNYIRFASSGRLGDYARMLCVQQFNLKFIQVDHEHLEDELAIDEEAKERELNQLEIFLNSLRKYYKKQYATRDLVSEEYSPKEIILECIKKDELDAAFDEIDEFIQLKVMKIGDQNLMETQKMEEVEKSILVIRGRYTRNEKRYRKGIIKDDEYSRELNMISDSIVSIVNEF